MYGLAARCVRTAYAVPEVQAVFTIAGDPDALVNVRVRDIEHLQHRRPAPRRAGHRHQDADGAGLVDA
ncbi:Lrp/AsnC ligand binding domain-containing protein [Streptomyces malaysiensis]|uniref:Lrp/AsnC ligand binding domain-containing protein n=1 Tax=Streptomyces malaysiensis TaxID=92644 RepID=UPI003716B41A